VTFTALVAFVTPFLTQICKGFIRNSLAIQIVSWLIGIAIAFAGYALKIGFLAGLPLWAIAVYGLAAGLIANGVFDTGLITGVLEFLGLKKKA
jgi:hypothetical protein